MAVANLSIIRRQRDPELRRVVEAAPERPREAFELLQQQGRISKIPDVNQRYKRITADLPAGSRSWTNHVGREPGQRWASDPNGQIRDLLVERGYVQNAVVALPAGILFASLLSAICATCVTHRPDQMPYQVSREDQRLIGEGRMLERIWLRLSRAEQKRLERFAAH
jgi:hypothetical protein